MAALSLISPLSAELSQDSERLNLEIKMQQRVEEALGKILAPGQFVVVIRIEPLPSVSENQAKEKDQEGFYLPGVPVRNNFDRSGEQIQNLVDTLKSDSKFQRFIRRIYVTLVLDEAISEEVVGKVRELTRQMLSLDPARGDTIDVQRTAFNKPVDPDANPKGLSRFQKEVRSYWVLITLIIIVFCVVVFFLFMFGPLRGFLNTFLQILPMLKQEEAAKVRGRFEMGGGMPFFPPSYTPQNFGLPGPANYSPTNFSGSLQVENPNKTILPFGFVREDHLGNLAVLLARETPEKAAVVLGYLPPEWITRVLSKMDPGMQTEVAAHIATTRQLLPEQVEDIEQDLKRRLDYLVGGPDRIFAVYESLDADGQRRMFESLKDSRPEIAEELRRRTVLFEDLEKLESNALRALLREVDLQTIVMGLKGVSDSFRNRVLEHVTEGKAEIIREELELSAVGPGKATAEAQRKMVLIAKRLEREGQINIPQIEQSIPTSRYGGSLKSVLKLPPGLKIDDTLPPEQTDQGGDIKDRIRKFLNREPPAKERFPYSSKENPLDPKGNPDKGE